VGKGKIVFKYTQSARPTLYKGTEFRSELEAAWAAFFNRRGIIWDYEPLLDLNTWRPDFSIKTDEQQRLVEVKPYQSLANWKSDTSTLNKIQTSFSSNRDVFAILLGASPILPANFIFGFPFDDGIGQLDPIDMGDDMALSRDWNWAKNEVRWKP
jgi:hypothetical protein